MLIRWQGQKTPFLDAPCKLYGITLFVSTTRLVPLTPKEAMKVLSSAQIKLFAKGMERFAVLAIQIPPILADLPPFASYRFADPIPCTLRDVEVVICWPEDAPCSYDEEEFGEVSGTVLLDCMIKEERGEICQPSRN